MMTPEEAKIELSFHSCRNSDINNPLWENGFLGSLRPYKGTPVEENFHDVIACLKTLSDDIRSSNHLEKTIVADISTITHLGRAWAVYENSMLRRNNLIAEKDWKTIENWVDCIAYAFMCLVNGTDNKVAFEAYNEYVS